MGEWSKKIGEFGEDLIDEFFKMIGWGDAQKGIQLTCFRPEKHTLSDHNRTTHGIDRLFSYDSKLIQEQLEIIIVSVKYTSKIYPKSPNSTFKNYFKDLAHTIECFKFSEERRNINNSAVGVYETKDIGVLFWLSNDKETDDDIISKVENANIDSELEYDAIYLVDNKRAAFLYYSISFARRKFANQEVDFYYQDTGKNMNPLVKVNRGKVLPVQFINSTILPFRIENLQTSEISLLLTSADDFDKNDLKRLIGLAQHITQDWAGKVFIAFPDYNRLSHDNIVQEVKLTFGDKNFTEKISVESFIDDFRNSNQ